ncbi:hypothetical protein FRB93_007001 [Tulasnella sp. JGI-2019a]|nr:hypothetical protein FRB93_007001 [Tulasnella sp. JGI-2019a]
MGDEPQAHESQSEFEVQAHIWDASVMKPHIKKFKSQRKEEKRSNKNNQPHPTDESPRKLRERASLKSFPSATSSSIWQGHWRPVTLRFSSRGQDATYAFNAPSPASQRTLEVLGVDNASLHSIYIHLLSQTDIRTTHPSLFSTKHVMSIHCRVGQALGLPTQRSNPELDAQYRSSPVQPLTPRSLPAHELLHSQSSASTSYAPLYIAFSSPEMRQEWLALLKCYAKPEIHNSRAIPGSDRIKNAGGLFRVWRGLALEVIEARGLVGCHGTVSLPGPLPSPSASNTEFSSFSFGGSDLESTSLMVDQDVFCEVHLDSALAGRTTSKRVPLVTTSLGASVDSSVVWNETIQWEGLPAHNTLEVYVWRNRSKSDKNSFTSLSTSQLSGTGASLKSSMSSGVAMISGAAKKKDREPTLVGTVTIMLPNFRRGEQVEGWWAVIPPAVVHSHGFGCCGAAELRIKITYDEDFVLPSPAYSTLISILQDHDTFDILDLVYSAADRNSASFSHAHPPDMKEVINHIQIYAIATGTFVQSLLASIQREIITFGSQNNTLFRNNTSTTKAMEFAMGWYGKAWLDESIGKVLRRLVAENVQVVVDLSSIERQARANTTGKDGMHGSSELVNAAAELDANVKTLVYWCEQIWASVVNARGDCPNELRLLFQKIRKMVDQRWTPPITKLHHSQSQSGLPKKDYSRDDSDSTTSSDDPAEANEDPSYQKDLKWQAISAFVFLRFFSPAIITPHLHGLLDGFVTDGVRRTLVLIASHLTKLATLNMKVNQEEHMRPMKTFLVNQMPAMIDFLMNISDPIPDLPTTPHIPVALSVSDSQAVALHVRTRRSTLPLLHQESIPQLPYLIDRNRHLAAVVSTVVRNAQGPRTAISYGQPVKRDDANRAILGEPASFGDLQAACFEIQTELLICQEIAQGQGTDKRVKRRSRSSTNMKAGSPEKVVPPTTGMFGPGYARQRSSSRPSINEAVRIRPSTAGSRGESLRRIRSPVNSFRSPPISIAKTSQGPSAQSPISPTSPPVPFSQRPRSSSLSSGSDFDSLFVDDRKVTSSSAAETESRDHLHAIPPTGSRSDLEDAIGEPSRRSPIRQDRPMGLPGSTTHLPSGLTSQAMTDEAETPHRQVRRVNSNPAVYQSRLPLASSEELTPKRSKNNFFTFKGLLGGKNR